MEYTADLITPVHSDGRVCVVVNEASSCWDTQELSDKAMGM